MAQVTRPSSLVWRKATSSEAGGCVEVAYEGQVVFVRDSKNPTGAVLAVPSQDWRAFLRAAKDGRHDCNRE